MNTTKTLKLYNALSRTVDDFTPLDPANIKIYTCGPTVYSRAHIGNLASYVYWDLLVRTLTLNGYTVNRVLNLTDVGHLVSDADDGEDKLEKGAKREGKSVWEIAEDYIDLFLADFSALGLTQPAKICRATDYIEQNIALINRLTEQGYTYETTDGIYFDTSKFPTYADLAGLDLEGLKAGARVEFNREKRNVSDFALWKFIQPGELHAMRWDYLGRPGYPGWHIECSSIIHAELGEPIDIHTGGIDHLPIHHTNEIAQSEAAFDQKLANFWLHCNFITVDGQKISKSLGNTYSLDDLAAQGFSPLDFKLWVLQGHYQSADRNFSLDDLTAAQNRRQSWRNRLALTYQQDTAATPDLPAQILSAVNHNLDSVSALALIDASTPDLATWRFIDQLFGLDLVASTPDLTAEQYQLIADRNRARTAKDFATSDRLRDQLFAQGIVLNDGPVTTWSVK